MLNFHLDPSPFFLLVSPATQAIKCLTLASGTVLQCSMIIRRSLCSLRFVIFGVETITEIHVPCPGVGVLAEKLGGGVRHVPETLTLFQTIFRPDQKFDTLFQT